MMKKLLVIIWALAFICNSELLASGLEFPLKHPSSCLNTSGLAGSLKSFTSVPQSYPGKGIFLNVSGGYSRIYNKDFYEDKDWSTTGGIGFNVDAGYFIRFQRYIGLGLGVGMSNFQAEAQLDDFNQDFPAFDIDGDEVKQNIAVLNLIQQTNLLFFDIPLFIELGNPNTHNVSFYARLGAKFSFPLTYDFTSSGETTINGYYPQYYVTLEDIPELGYESHKSIVISNETSIKSFNVSLMCTAGVTFPLSDYFILKVGANLNYGLTEISEEKLQPDDTSYYLGNCNSLLMSPEGKTSVQSAGLEIGIIYILESKF